MRDFKTLKRRRRPNDYLVLPEGYDARATPDRLSPVFPVSRGQLGLLVKRVALAEPRTKMLSDDEDAGWFEFEQLGKTLRFPADITVECVHRGEDASALAVWSRSRYGIFDRGANRKRIERWIAAIEMRIGGNTKSR